MRCVLIATVCVPVCIAHGQQQADSAAAAAFEKMIQANRNAEAIDVTANLVISLSQQGTNADGEEVKAVFKRLKNGDGLITVRGYTLYLNGKNLYAIHESNEDEYFTAEIGDFAYYTVVWDAFASFDRIPFPLVSILWGSDEPADQYMEIYADTPEIVPTAYVDRMVDGKAVRTLELGGADGTLKIDLDPQTMMVQSMTHTITGGWTVQPGTTKTLTYAVEYPEGGMNVSPDDIRFAMGDRQRVDSILTLDKQDDILAQQQNPPPDLGGGGEGPMVGKPAPGFLLPTLDGELVDLSKLRDQVVVIDFWATWCQPCVRALPELHKVAAWAKEKGLPVKVFAINTFENGATLEEKIRNVRAFWQNAGHTLPVLMDDGSDVAELYGVSGIPATFVIAPDGVISAQHSGFGPTYGEDLADDIQKALEM